MDQFKPQNSDRQYYLFALRIAGDFGATIAVPVVLFAWLGRKLDMMSGGGIKYTLAGFVLAACLSGIMIFKKAKKFGIEYQNLVDKTSKK